MCSKNIHVRPKAEFALVFCLSFQIKANREKKTAGALGLLKDGLGRYVTIFLWSSPLIHILGWFDKYATVFSHQNRDLNLPTGVSGLMHLCSPRESIFAF